MSSACSRGVLAMSSACIRGVLASRFEIAAVGLDESLPRAIGEDASG
jgi:hypothetical protein